MAKRKLYYVERAEIYMIGGKTCHYLVKAKNEQSALNKVGIGDKTDESFGVIKELPESILEEVNLVDGALLAEVEQ